MTVLPLAPDTLDQALRAARPERLGRLVELKGLHLLSRGVDGAVGEVVEVLADTGRVEAEVVASSAAGAVCLPLGSTRPTPRRWTAPSSRTVRSPLSPTRRSLPAVPCSRPRRPRSTPVSRRRSPACGRP